MNVDRTFLYDQILKDKYDLNNFYKLFGFLVFENVFNNKNCDEMKKRAVSLVNKDKSIKTIGFSLKKNKHHSDNNFLSSSYKINYFYEDKMINSDGTFKDKKINCISKLGHCLHDIDEVFNKYSYHDKLKNLIQAIKFKNPVLSQSSYIFKQPFIGGEYLWHQDSTYLHTDPLSCTALWIAIDNAEQHNGCLQIIPGSHKHKIRKRIKCIKGKIISENLINKKWNERGKFPLCVKKGSVIILHGSLAHKSSMNSSNMSRNAYVLHFFDKKAKYSKDNWLQRPKFFPFYNYS